MFQRKNRSFIPVCPTAEMPDTFSLKEIALQLNMKIAFQQKLLDIILCGGQYDTFVDESGVTKPLVYRTQKSITGQTFRIHKEGLLTFLNKYQSVLEGMGVDKRRLYALIYDMESISKPTSDVLSLWDLSFRFTKNSKIISKVSAYIAENFAPLSYVDKDGKVQSVFVFSKGKTGRSALYFKKDALDFFCTRYGDMIVKAVEAIERDNPYWDLRSLSRKLNGSGSYEIELKKFIFRNCLNDTFETVDEKGNVVTEKIFDLSDGRTLNIRKQAFPTFVERNKTALEAMGCKGLERFLCEEDYQEISSDEITLKDLALQWGHASFEEPLIRLAQEKGRDFVKVVDTKTESKMQPVLKQYYLRGNTSFVIHKNDIPSFIANFKDELVQMGISEPVLEQFYLGKPVVRKTEEMFEIRQMLDYLCISRENKKQGVARVRKIIHENPQLVGDIFVPSSIWAGVDLVFKNQEKMHKFIDMYQEDLVACGIRPLKIVDRLGHEEVLNFNEEEYVRLSQLSDYYHLKYDSITDSVMEKYLNETYSTTDEKGVKVDEKVFTPVRLGSREYVFYALKKEAALAFAKKHKEEFSIRQSIIDALEGKIRLVDKTPDLITLYNVAMMGRSGKGTDAFYSFVEKNCMNDTFVQKDTKNGGFKVEPIFTYARTRNGYISLHCNKKGLDTFFKNRKEELKAVGFDANKCRTMMRRSYARNLREDR